MNYEEILGQSLSILGVITTAISYQLNNRRTILAVHSAAILFICLGYYFLGATSGFTLNVVCFIRNIAYCFLKNNRKVNFAVTAFFALCMIVVGALSWQDYFSLFIIIALAINTSFMGLGTPQQLRKSILLTSSLVFAYNVIVFSIGGMLNELMAIASSIVGIIRFAAPRKNASKDAQNR